MRRIDELLTRFLDRIGQSEGTLYVGMFRSWRRIVGDRIADHAEPVDIRSHALVVEADHPGWVQMVMMERTRIIRRINREFPQLGITGLHVRVTGQRTEKAESAANDTPVPEATENPPSASDSEALKKIEDGDLRDSLSRLRRSLKPSKEVPGNDAGSSSQDL